MELIKRYGLSFYEMASDNSDDAYLAAKRLLESLFFQLSKLSTKFCNEKYDFCDLPYTYTERRLDSVLLPALSKICDSLVLTELPVDRKLKGDLSKGRIDYWCIFEGYSFIIELKQSYDDFGTDKTRKNSIQKRWKTMIEQLDSVKLEARAYEEKTKGVIRIGIHMITSYTSKVPTQELVASFNKEKIFEIAQRFQKDISKKTPAHKTDLLLCWKIPPRIVKSNDYMTFPALWLAATIYPPIIHAGIK